MPFVHFPNVNFSIGRHANVKCLPQLILLLTLFITDYFVISNVDIVKRLHTFYFHCNILNKTVEIFLLPILPVGFAERVKKMFLSVNLNLTTTMLKKVVQRLHHHFFVLPIYWASEKKNFSYKKKLIENKMNLCFALYLVMRKKKNE